MTLYKTAMVISEAILSRKLIKIRKMLIKIQKTFALSFKVCYNEIKS